jgi:hypothetical protein
MTIWFHIRRWNVHGSVTSLVDTLLPRQCVLSYIQYRNDWSTYRSSLSEEQLPKSQNLKRCSGRSEFEISSNDSIAEYKSVNERLLLGDYYQPIRNMNNMRHSAYIPLVPSFRTFLFPPLLVLIAGESRDPDRQNVPYHIPYLCLIITLHLCLP